MPTDEPPGIDPARPDVLFWYGRPSAPGERVWLDEDESRHVRSVLRRARGDAVWLADGSGAWLSGRIAEFRRENVEVEILQVVAAPTAGSPRVTLAFPLLRSGRTEILLEKCTELGVTDFVPIAFERARPGEARLSRWQKVVRTAAMQSLRPAPPVVHPEVALDRWIQTLEGTAIRWVATPDGQPPEETGGGPAALAVGPEGDFSSAERSSLDRAGFRPVGLGAARLRTETAAIALAAALGLTLNAGR